MEYIPLDFNSIQKEIEKGKRKLAVHRVLQLIPLASRKLRTLTTFHFTLFFVFPLSPSFLLNLLYLVRSPLHPAVTITP